jgi:hypothetical protein
MNPLQQSKKIILTPPKRLTEVLSRLRGYDVSGRNGDDSMDDTLMQQMNRLRKMEILEEKMFQPSVDILMNKKSGELVLDDELIGSRSNDVECKTLIHRKSGKEGPVVDAIADSHVGCLLGMQLRVKGESELDNVMKLFERFPTL